MKGGNGPLSSAYPQTRDGKPLSDNTGRIRLKILFPTIILFAIIAAVYFFTALDGSMLLTERDLSVFFIPPRLLWVEQALNLDLPLWNPYTYGGQPLFATLQPGILYPINILLLVLPFDVGFNWTIIIHFVIAPVSMYCLARESGASEAGSVCAALVYMLTGYLFSVHNVISTLFTVSWAPLAVFLYMRAIKRGSAPYAVLTAVVLTIMFMAGGIEALFATIVLFALLLAVPSALATDKDDPIALPSQGRRLFLASVSIGVFLLLSAVQLLPFLELAGQSTRAGGLTYFEATTWSLGLKDFIQFFIPDPFGYGTDTQRYWANQSWLKSIYTGVIPVMLGVFFLIGRVRRALPLIALFMIFLVLAMGGNTALYKPLYEWFPFFNKFRYPVKFLFIDFLLLSVAAGIGFDYLRTMASGVGKTGSRTRAVLLLVSLAGALAFGAVNFFGADILSWMKASGIDSPAYNSARINIFNTKRLFFFLTVVPLFICASSKRLPKALGWSICALLVIDLFFAHNGYYVTADSAVYHSKGAVTEFLSEDKTLYRTFVTPRTLSDPIEVPDDGVFSRDELKSINLDKERLLGYNIEHHIQDAGGVEVMRRGDYMSVYEMATRQKAIDETNLLAMLNVKYVISIPPIDSPGFALRKVVGAVKGDLRGLDEYKTFKIYENLNVVPRFYIAGRYHIVKSAQELAGRLVDKRFMPLEETLLTEEPRAGAAPEDLTPANLSESVSSGVRVIEYSSNSAVLEVSTDKQALLVAAENWYPGWVATIDGTEVPILKANYIQRAVAVPKGTHTVRFEYRPASFMIGAAVSGLTALSIIICGFYLRFKRTKAVS